MMKRVMRLFCASIGIMLSFQLFSQFTSTEERDPEATEILERVQSKIENAESFAVNFKLEIAYPDGDPITLNGRMIQQGESFHLDMTDYLIISNTELRWVYTKEDNIVSLYNADSESGWVTPADFLQIYNESEFVYSLLDPEFAPNKIDQWIEFKSLDEDFDYFKVRTSIAPNSDELKTVTAFSRDGSRYLLTVNTMDFSPSIPSNQFEFDKSAYPGVKVEDLRID